MLSFVQRKLLLNLALIGLSFFGISCDDQNSNGNGLGTTKSSTIEITPAEFVFYQKTAQQLQASPVDSSVVVIKNTGLATLKLASINTQGVNLDELTLKWYQGSDSLESATNAGIIQDGISKAANAFSDVVEIAAGQSISMVLYFQPLVATNIPSGSVRFQTNSSNNTDVTIPIRGQSSEAQIIADPNPMDFGRVPVGTTKTMDLTVTNLGSSDLILSRMALNGDTAFSVALKSTMANPVADPAALLDPDQDGVNGISAGLSAVFTVTYAPMIEGGGVGQLVISNNDSNSSEYIVNLNANGASPCINVVVPGSVSAEPTRYYDQDNVLHVKLEFPPALIGRTATQDVIIESCGAQALNVSNITYNGDMAYVLDSLPALPTDLPANANPGQGPAPSGNFKVKFTPSDADIYQGAVLIESSDAVNQRVIVDITGRGTVNACPVASVAVAEFDALPLDIINLDASTSTDADSPNGKPESYEWTVLQRPNGSTAQVVERYTNPARPADGGSPDDTSTPNALFFVDLAGEYQISLKVKDSLGFTAPSNECPQQEVVVLIHAVPNEDIHIQLVWHTPQDPDETDEFGTDVDLHFFHPQSMLTNPSRAPAWAIFPYDCYYANTNPDWGPQGPNANPSLDIDDISGAGPENINLNQPEDTSRLGENYRVGVHYYRAEADFTTSWASEVTARIYIGGSLAGEWVTTLRNTDQYWEVASIIWNAGERRAVEINRIY